MGGASARRWWHAALASETAEIWVGELGGSVVGVLVLVLDESGWAHERKARDGGRLARVAALMRAPSTFLPEVERRITLRLAARRTTLPARATTGERTWVELLAVSKLARGRRVASVLKIHAEERTRELGRRIIESSVHPKNAAMCRVNENLGYRHTAQTQAGRIYSKELDRTS